MLLQEMKQMNLLKSFQKTHLSRILVLQNYLKRSGFNGQKEKLLKKISDVLLEKPITMAGIAFDKKEFPELAPYMHTEKLSGLQLYAVMTELFAELNPKQAKEIGKSYPDFPR